MAMANPDRFSCIRTGPIVTSGDDLQTMLDRARRNGPKYELEHRVTVKGEPALEIYQRMDDPPQIPDNDKSLSLNCTARRTISC